MSDKDSVPSAAWVTPTLLFPVLGGAKAPWAQIVLEEDDAMFLMMLRKHAAEAAEFGFEPLLSEYGF